MPNSFMLMLCFDCFCLRRLVIDNKTDLNRLFGTLKFKFVLGFKVLNLKSFGFSPSSGLQT